MPDLTATYASPSTSSPHTISASLPAIPAAPSTDDRVAYLAELQKVVKNIQGDVNVFLTQKMEEEKAAGGNAKLDDAKAEENYGEEVVEGD
jgi:hypothetical protein